MDQTLSPVGSRPSRRSRRLGLLLVVAGIVGSLAGAGRPEGVKVDPAKTRVGLARVNLFVDDLRIAEGAIVGRYAIRVPLAPWRNDEGQLHLDVSVPLDEIVRVGGTLTGTGSSSDDGQVSPVSCEFGTDGSLQIVVATRKHRLSFATRYYLLD